MGERIDIRALADELDFDSEEVERLSAMFFKSTAKALDAMAKAIEAQDREAIYKAAHSIKGSAGILRLGTLQSFALEIETAGRTNQSIDYGAALVRLTRMIGAIDVV